MVRLTLADSNPPVSSNPVQDTGSGTASTDENDAAASGVTKDEPRRQILSSSQQPSERPMGSSQSVEAVRPPTIPIAVPPGTAGMEPKLSVGYDSQVGNGLWESVGT